MRNLLVLFFSIIMGLMLNGQNSINQNIENEEKKATSTSTSNTDGYNEVDVLKELERYVEYPMQFYADKEAMKIKLEKANQTTVDISNEYLDLIDKKDSIIVLYKAELDAVKTLYEELKDNKQTSKQGNTKPVVAIERNDGVTYRVQLSAFNKNDFNQYFRKSAKFFGVQDLGDRTVMDIRGFDDSDEAFEFSQKMRKLGFNGAFVTKYEDGYRDESYDYLQGSGLSGNYYSKKAEKVRTSLNLDYPDHVPQGYKEIMGHDGVTSGEVTEEEESYRGGATKAAKEKVDDDYDPENNALDAAFDKLFKQ